MKQYIIIDTATGKRLHADMDIYTARTAMILVARLAANGVKASYESKEDYNRGIYADQESFLWGEGASESSKPSPQPGDRFPLSPL